MFRRFVSGLFLCALLPCALAQQYPARAIRIIAPTANIGSGLVRAVGGACGANPIPLLIPCHRVIRGDGELGVFDRVRPDRVLVAVANRGSVGAGGVELHMVDVHLDFGVAIEHVLVAFSGASA